VSHFTTSGKEGTLKLKKLQVFDPQHLRFDAGYPRGDHPLTQGVASSACPGPTVTTHAWSPGVEPPSPSGTAHPRERTAQRRRRADVVHPSSATTVCAMSPAPLAGSRPGARGAAALPVAAVDWLVGEQPARVLDLGSGRGSFAATLADAGHEVFCLDQDPQRVATLPARLGTRLHVAGQVESMPYLSCHFDVVTASQTLHRFAPGLAVTEIARVLRPGGQLAVVYQTRDDTVPWVRRLMGILQRVDPSAMQGAYGDASVAEVAESPYFSGLERRDFRTWVPTTRSGLVAMAERRPAVAALAPAARDAILAEVGALYDSSARAPEPLLLPFRTSCWRAQVDHTQLAIDDDPALTIAV
jgi:ubiquinone/menaquinone biosynthesis C-methylase UbiE